MLFHFVAFSYYMHYSQNYGAPNTKLRGARKIGANLLKVH